MTPNNDRPLTLDEAACGELERAGSCDAGSLLSNLEQRMLSTIATLRRDVSRLTFERDEEQRAFQRCEASRQEIAGDAVAMRRERDALVEGLRRAEVYVCRVTLAANLSRAAWFDACHAHAIIRCLLRDPEPKVKPDVR